jgi:hypothetical protein
MPPVPEPVVVQMPLTHDAVDKQLAELVHIPPVGTLQVPVTGSVTNPLWHGGDPPIPLKRPLTHIPLRHAVAPDTHPDKDVQLPPIGATQSPPEHVNPEAQSLVKVQAPPPTTEPATVGATPPAQAPFRHTPLAHCILVVQGDPIAAKVVPLKKKKNTAAIIRIINIKNMRKYIHAYDVATTGAVSTTVVPSGYVRLTLVAIKYE